MTILRPSFASRAFHLSRASLNLSDLGKRPSSWNGSVAAAAVASGAAGIILLLTSHESNIRTRPSRTVQLSSSTKVFYAKSRNFCPEHYLSNASICPIQTVRCDANCDDVNSNDEDEEEEQLLPLDENGENVSDLDSGYTEAERFYQCLDYHRSLLFDYRRRWEKADTEHEEKGERGEDANASDKKTSNSNHNSWPRRVPTDGEISALETDLKFCLRDPNHVENSASCHNLQFRIASYYLAQDDPVSQRNGFKKIKLLAEQGHPDAMCYYGVLLNEGKIAGVEANPQQAVVWFRRCVDYHRHIKAMYELATANYLGEGTPESPETAVKLYRRAAHLGHAGAAYMLGECLLDGVGAERDRENALEWLVTAAELGHVLARQRVLTILMEDSENLDAGQANEQRTQEEAEKWINLREEQKVKRVNIERRFSIGGGSRNPKVMERRRTKVRESRDEALA